MTHPYSDASAAELLTYTQKLIPDLGDLLVRDVGAAQEWRVKHVDGVVYAIRFDQFFEKKHLVTFSKKDNKLGERVQKLKADPSHAGKTDAELLALAKLDSANAKAQRMALNRSGAVLCRRCGHARESHQWKKSGGYCKGPPANTCDCTQFVSDYVDRQVKKFGENPVGRGNMNPANSSIIMNLVPRPVFEKALLDSLRAPRVQSDPQKRPREYRLRLDFGPACRGSVVQATAGDSAAWARWEGCHVIADRSDSSTATFETWTVNHMETDAKWYF